MHLKTRKYKDIHPGEIIAHLKECRVEVKCLQREGLDYLLTVEDPHHKSVLLEKGSIIVNQKCINMEDPDYKTTHINIFGALYELLDEIIKEQLQEFGDIVGKHQGRYAAHPEVENGIHHWWMLLYRPVPGML